MFSKVNTAVCHGVTGITVTVETDIKSGLPNMSIVGLASTTVMESRERIKSAIINSGFDYPRGRITVNLTPSDLRKNGSAMDLPIAVGLLASTLYADAVRVREYGIIGALSLDGEVLGVDGVLPMAIGMMDSGIKKIIVPWANYNETALVNGAKVIPVNSLKECIERINSQDASYADIERSLADADIRKVSNPKGLDFADIKGQENAKRAISIAVAGRHGLLMIGSPGCGKTMLAQRIPGIMPQMSERELIETAIVYSASGRTNQSDSILIDRPFRSPHNTIGRAGLLGGGMYPVPGEITLAHNGVLFLDEVCEFDRENIESLRTPVEEKYITHFRGGEQYTFPCNFQLIMAANPCKCGYYGDPDRICKCSISQLEQYRRKLSGPMMDRIDIRVSMEKVAYKEISGKGDSCRSTEELKNDVARGIGFARSMGRMVFNADIFDSDIRKYCHMDNEACKLMDGAYAVLSLSPRSYNKILKVARTIADMDESEIIKKDHLAEALSYRLLNEINNS